MNKNTFLEELRRALAGEVSEDEVRSNIDYYNNYIMDEVKRGRTEAQVLAELGDPALIAKTIIAAGSMQAGTGRRSSDSYYTDPDYEEARKEAGKKGFHAEYDEDQGVNIRFGRLKLNTWYGRLMLLAIVLLAVFLVISLVVSILAFLIPIVLPILIILVVLSLFRGRNAR